MASGIGRASALLASGTLVSRVLGFVKIIVLAQTIGVVGSASADAFGNANQLPNNIYVIVAGGVLNAVLVPQVVRAAKHADGGRSYINRLVTIALVILAGTTVLATAAAPAIAYLYGVTLGPEQLALVTAFAFWCLPQIFFYGLYAVLGEVLNARGSFGPFTWAPVLNNVVAIAGLGVFSLLFGADPDGSRPLAEWTVDKIAVLGGSATAGVAAQALILFYFWRRAGLQYRPDFRWRGVGLGKAGRIASWTLGMLIITQISGVVQTNVANLAFGVAASIAALQTAWLIFMLPHSVATVSIATAYFTRMSEHASNNDLTAVRSDFSAAVRVIGMIIVLATAVLVVVAYPFSRVFESGFENVQGLGNVLIAYLFGLTAFSVLFMIQRAFYTLEDTKTPFFFTLFQVVLFILGALLCTLLPVEWIAVGLAVVSTITGGLQALLAAYLLRKRLGSLDGHRILRSLVQFTVAAIVSALVGFIALVALGGNRADGLALSSVVGALVTMIVVGTVMTVVYLAILRLMRSAEFATLANPVIARLRRLDP
ncbi:murein biosynthesis integral membrane protein MurJ [Planctomonas psychrotolerans]|uniref:murein biosynthesis integral membrane protein MurJ n=1 Tax=Planctomonas psychrotolerans TaxID=2528712 RepID=UPI0012385508|nr:murein biosynthesis integral membrane protein MurJ [Planctomonas psychrotolerans]